VGWSVGVRILFMAVNMVKEFNSRAGIAACLKVSTSSLSIFYSKFNSCEFFLKDIIGRNISLVKRKICQNYLPY
jgi:hypothetical protein